jgi:hypothetical protein
VSWKQFTKVPWPITVSRAESQWRRYGGKFTHDSNGVGDVIDDFIKVNPVEKRLHVVNGLDLRGKLRTDVFVDYIAAIENHKIRYPMIDYAYKDHKFATNEDLFTTAGHPPDSFVMGALAWANRPVENHHRPQGVGPVAIKKRQTFFGAGR